MSIVFVYDFLFAIVFFNLSAYRKLNFALTIYQNVDIIVPNNINMLFMWLKFCANYLVITVFLEFIKEYTLISRTYYFD